MNLKSTKADTSKQFRRLILLASSICWLTLATGARADENLDTVNVNSSSLECAPPIEIHACNDWRAEIRRHFTWREMGMLFDAATPYAEYRTSYSHVKERYERLKNEFAAKHQAFDPIAGK
jgi:hypothetical protein